MKVTTAPVKATKVSLYPFVGTMPDGPCLVLSNNKYIPLWNTGDSRDNRIVEGDTSAITRSDEPVVLTNDFLTDDPTSVVCPTMDISVSRDDNEATMPALVSPVGDTSMLLLITEAEDTIVIVPGKTTLSIGSSMNIDHGDMVYFRGAVTLQNKSIAATQAQ